MPSEHSYEESLHGGLDNRQALRLLAVLYMGDPDTVQ